MEFTIQEVSFLVSEQVSPLPEEMLEHIFSFSDTYNVVNRTVCRDFRRIAPEVDPLLHLDHLLSTQSLTPKERSFTQTSRMVQKAIRLQLLNVLDFYIGYVPGNLCSIAVKLGLVEVLYWARSKECRVDNFPWYGDESSSNPKVIEWMKGESHIFIKPIRYADFDGDAYYEDGYTIPNKRRTVKTLNIENID